jgi:hypothetical protein
MTSKDRNRTVKGQRRIEGRGTTDEWQARIEKDKRDRREIEEGRRACEDRRKKVK